MTRPELILEAEEEARTIVVALRNEGLQVPLYHALPGGRIHAALIRFAELGRDEALNVCENAHHEREQEWDWDVPGNDRRAQFYKHNIVHAYRQAALHTAKRIRALFEGEEGT